MSQTRLSKVTTTNDNRKGKLSLKETFCRLVLFPKNSCPPTKTMQCQERFTQRSEKQEIKIEAEMNDLSFSCCSHMRHISGWSGTRICSTLYLQGSNSVVCPSKCTVGPQTKRFILPDSSSNDCSNDFLLGMCSMHDLKEVVELSLFSVAFVRGEKKLVPIFCKEPLSNLCVNRFQ